VNESTVDPQPARVNILAATEADVPAILVMIRELAGFEKLSHEVVATEDSLRTSLFGPRPVAECVLARDGAAPVGFALFFSSFSTFLGKPGLYLEDLYVRTDHRGRGVGEALLRHLAGLAVARGCGRMEWAVLDWNKRAIDFYKRVGAQELDDWTTFRLTGDALVRFGS
jgi:GNAT superfamily N-acetyltransferase